MGQPDATSVVPTLVGLPAEDAHNRALDSKLLAVDQDPTHKASSPGRVTAQPSPGSQLTMGGQIMIWVEDAPDDGGGGGGGSRPVPVGPAPVTGAGAR